MTETLERQDIELTESAARRIAHLMGEEGHPGLMLRIAVSGGGCSGFQYGFSFDDSVQADDRTFERAGAKVVIDEVSLELLRGSEIDFVKTGLNRTFQFKNPNVTEQCGCGESFTID